MNLSPKKHSSFPTRTTATEELSGRRRGFPFVFPFLSDFHDSLFVHSSDFFALFRQNQKMIRNHAARIPHHTRDTPEGWGKYRLSKTTRQDLPPRPTRQDLPIHPSPTTSKSPSFAHFQVITPRSPPRPDSTNGTDSKTSKASRPTHPNQIYIPDQSQAWTPNFK